MRKTVLVTGGAGFIGSHVAARLEEDFQVVIIDDLSGGELKNIPMVSRFIEMSCLDTAKLDRLFKVYKPSFVIHCAAMAAENLSHNCRVHTYTNNLVGEATIRNAAIKHDVECMVSLSSIAVMGHKEPPYTEEDTPEPADPYGISKLAGEMDAIAAQKFFGLPYVIFRPHNVIGTRQNMADRYRNVAAIFIRAIKEKRPLPIFGDGKQTRAFSPVSYVADIIAASIQRPATWNQIYNVGSDEPMTILDLKTLLEDHVDCTLPVEHHAFRPEAVHAHMRHDKIRTLFPDITPTETVSDVLKDMLDEAFSHTLPPMQKGPVIEIHKNLPPSWAPQA